MMLLILAEQKFITVGSFIVLSFLLLFVSMVLVIYFINTNAATIKAQRTPKEIADAECNEFKRKADEAQCTADEAKRRADEARSNADAAKNLADEAQRRADAVKWWADEAQRQLDALR